VTWIAAALAVAAAFVALRWWTRRYDALGRARRFPVISVVGLAVLAIAAATPAYLRHREEDRLSSVASQLVGQHVTVHCQTFGQVFFQVGGELGFVKYGPDAVPEHHTTIMHGPCGALRSYLGSNKRHPSADEVVAVHVLTHESMHMRGITNEADAECAAVQRDETTAELLGADPASARLLARLYWLTDYPRMPANYTSPDCVPGGALDEHLPTAPWLAPTS
jgi:membrane protein implicated in regulation of membrane protease activity